MIEILSKNDIDKVKDIKLKEYLEYSFKRLPSDFEYPEYGSFVIIESIEELKSNPIKLKTCELPSINDELFETIELVEIKDDVIEIVILIHNDFGVSLIAKTNIFNESQLEKLLKLSC